MQLKLILFFYFLTTVYARFKRRIIGGLAAESGLFPNVVTVYSTELGQGETEYLFSDGTLYNARWIVLTAKIASKIGNTIPYDYVRAIAGTISTVETPSTLQMRNVILSRIYADHVRNVLGRSINLGLLKVDEEFEYNENISPIPFSPYDVDPSRSVVIASFGSTTLDQVRDRDVAPEMQVIEDNVMSYSMCMNSMTSLVQNGQLAEMYINRYNFCTGSFRDGVRGPSFGDFGSPVMQVNEEGKLNVIGIISEGIAELNVAVHTSIYTFIPWIEYEISSYDDI